MLRSRYSSATRVRLTTFLGCLFALTATPAVAARSWNARALSVPAAHFAIADFDGDNQPDLVTVQAGLDRSSTRYWIHFQFSTGLRDAIGVDAPSGGLRITSRDVNGDHFLDLIVTTAWQHRPVAVLLNDGHGKFTLRDPAPFPSAGFDSDISWASASTDVTDAVAAILTRSLSGTWGPHGRTTSEQLLRGLLISEDSPASSVSDIVSFFGRAPPSRILHA